jgi:hypothetical protein
MEVSDVSPLAWMTKTAAMKFFGIASRQTAVEEWRLTREDARSEPLSRV